MILPLLPQDASLAATNYAVGVCVGNDQPGGRGTWPFDRPFPLILNPAIGGDWGGPKGPTTTRCRSG